MSKPQGSHGFTARADLPAAVERSLGWLVEAVLKEAGELPPGYHRSNIRTMLRAMAMRSFNANGPDLPPDTFTNSSS